MWEGRWRKIRPVARKGSGWQEFPCEKWFGEEQAVGGAVTRYVQVARSIRFRSGSSGWKKSIFPSKIGSMQEV